MEDNNPSSTLGYNADGSATAVKITTIAIVLTVIFLFLLIIFAIFLYLYTYYFVGRSVTRRRAARGHFIFAAGDAASLPGLGLNPSILLSLPITIYRSNDLKEGLHCAVCLSELTDGEKARLLPNCSHGFHLECIDMWFHSHSTCPLCRCAVGGEDGLGLMESASLLAISIPDRTIEISSRSHEVEEMKSPVEGGGSPGRFKVGSLKRILSRGKRIGDAEQGLGGYGEVNGEGSSVFTETLKIPTL